MSTIHVIARFKIHDGGLETFKTAAEECKRIVREQDRKTLQYEWFFNADETECVVLERYADSEGLLDHIAHVGQALGALITVSSISIESFGDHSDELIETTRPFGPTIYTPF